MPSKVTLSEYFRAVDRHLENTGKMPRESFRIQVCGQCIELRFPSRELARIARLSLEGCVTEDTAAAPDAVFLYWYDRCDAYLPAGEAARSAMWRSGDDTGSLQIGTDSQRMIGADCVRRRYYYAMPQPEGVDTVVYGHTVAGLFSRWAGDAGMILMHAAAVGSGGKGVLIVGRSGSGKSTFSVSCLMEGLDFVSDDYVLLSRTGPVEAMPLYTNIAVNPDMYERMPPSERLSAPAYADWWNGKLHFHLDRKEFCPSLEIRAIVMPRVTGGEEPAIALSPLGAAMTQLIHSSLEQLERYRDTQLVRQMAARLGHLPVYEMQMSTDLTKNPAFLRRFIEKEL